MIDQAQSFRRSAQLYGANLAAVTGDREYTYAEVHERAARLGNALRDRGLAARDVVAILGPNTVEQVEQIVGCALGNFPRAGLYTYNSPDINAYLLERIGAKAFIVHASLYEAAEPPVVLVTGEDAPEELSYEQALAAASPEDVVVEVRQDDAHIIRFSSGTTGRPKPVFHSVERWARTTEEWTWITPTMTDRTRYVTPIAIAHLGIGLVWNVLKTGGAIIPQPIFDADGALDLMEQYGATHVAAAPVMVRAMVEAYEQRPRDLSALQCLMYAGSPIAPQTMERAIAIFGQTLHQLYAQSEALPATMLFPHEHVVSGDEQAMRRARSVGRPSPNATITVRDEEDNILPPGEVGEIAVRSPFTMSGIWLDEEATNSRLSPDGAILTRDMGRLDEDGFVYLVDRKDDMIVSGGYNIWPTELENALLEHPAVADVAVFGVPDEKWGETPKAAVVLAHGASVTEAELVAHTRDLVGGVKKITSVDFLTALPRTTTGKIQRGDLKAPYWEGMESRIQGS
jgi:acyl-coenzyme A synthetase/AMP-(fatty) acid ligase